MDLNSLNVYKLYEYNHEGSSTYILLHDRKFSKKEFDDMVLSCFDIVMEQECTRYAKSKMSKKYRTPSTITWEHMIKKILNILLEKFGFILLNDFPTITVFSAEGWSNLIEDSLPTPFPSMDNDTETLMERAKKNWENFENNE